MYSLIFLSTSAILKETLHGNILMPKEYSDWLASMANSIEDKSYVDNFIGDKLTTRQKRMLIADILVPHPTSIAEIMDWTVAFCVDWDDKPTGTREIMSSSMSTILGPREQKIFNALVTREDYVAWHKELKTLIRNNQFRKYE